MICSSVFIDELGTRLCMGSLAVAAALRSMFNGPPGKCK